MSGKHFKLVSLTSIVHVLSLCGSNCLALIPHPAYNISINGPYDQYVVEVTGSCSQ